MSEYQYYQFLAVDPLNERQQAEVRAPSTRTRKPRRISSCSRDDAAHIMKTLEGTVGRDGFHSIAGV